MLELAMISLRLKEIEKKQDQEVLIKLMKNVVVRGTRGREDNGRRAEMEFRPA